MQITLNSTYLMVLLFCLTNCGMTQNPETSVQDKTVMEVTTFNIKTEISPMAFAQLDKQGENSFTSKQPGFIKRQSGVDEKGNYVVIVYWKRTADADASMQKFMNDSSVKDYAQMIDASTMKMERYTMQKPFNAVDSRFVEIMSFDVKSSVDIAHFDALNQSVETDFTSSRNGFLQRITGVNDHGRQVVAVYWASNFKTIYAGDGSVFCDYGTL